MIKLNEQILSFIISILYGYIFFYSYIKVYNYLYLGKTIYCFLNSLLFELIHTLIYFKLMYLINGGYINFYFIFLSILVHLFLYKKFTKKNVNKR